jgi:hypothetical protein
VTQELDAHFAEDQTSPTGDPAAADRLFAELAPATEGDRLLAELARLSEAELPPSDDYYRVLLQTTVELQGARGAAVWACSADGAPRLLYQMNLRGTGLAEGAPRQAHEEMLRQAVGLIRPVYLPPRGHIFGQLGDPMRPANPTDFALILVPVLVGRSVIGLLEAWYQAPLDFATIPQRVQALVRLAHFASLYHRNQDLQRLAGQEKRWARWEAFAQQVHRSLSPREVAALVADEGRAALECDRFSVGLCRGGESPIELVMRPPAPGGVSALARPLQSLARQVIDFGRQVVYRGAKDPQLPEDLARVLDEYQVVSGCRLLVVVPLCDQRAAGDNVAAALLVEWAGKTADEPTLEWVEPLSRHAASALANAFAYRRAGRRRGRRVAALGAGVAGLLGVLAGGLYVAGGWPGDHRQPARRDGAAPVRTVQATPPSEQAVRDREAALAQAEAARAERDGALQDRASALERARALEAERDRAQQEKAAALEVARQARLEAEHRTRAEAEAAREREKAAQRRLREAEAGRDAAQMVLAASGWADRAMTRAGDLLAEYRRLAAARPAPVATGTSPAPPPPSAPPSAPPVGARLAQS